MNTKSIKQKYVQQVEVARARLRMTKTEMAHKLGTSRSQLERLLDPDEGALTLDYLVRAAAVVGLKMHIKMSKIK